ncbi:hypothetical protein G6F44_000674 [Rhizopus delemar]|nr:hypothetical protein G6F44_000674 [Rhizopus delemar]
MTGEKTPLLTKQNDTCCSEQGCCSGSSQPDNQEPIVLQKENECGLSDQPWKYKLVALLCAMFLAVGSHFAAHTLGAMKSIIKKEFDISNSQYGAIQSSVSIVNTVLPLLGGIFIDIFGTIPGSIVTTILIAVGNILVALSTSSANLSMMIIGRVLYGIGSGTVVIVQETILSQWFKGRSLAAVIALMMTISRLSSFLAQATVVPIANRFGWYGYGFWFSAFLCLFSLFINLIYITLLKRILPTQDCRVQQDLLRSKKSFSWSKLMHLPHSFWLIASMEFLLGGGWGCFLHINSEYVKFRFGYPDQLAAGIASVAQVLPIFLMPVLGVMTDRYGKRTWMMIASGLAFLFALILLQYTPLHPILGMISFSISLALGPVALVSSVPIILPLSLVGTGMGLVKSGTNIGASLFDIFTGLLQDLEKNKGYDHVISFFILTVVAAIVSGVTLAVLNHTIYHNLLDAPASGKIDSNKQEEDMMNEKLKANYVGPSCSGKTTVTRILKRILKDVVVIYQDDFYNPDKDIPIDQETQLANWDCPEAIDFDRFLDTIRHTQKNKGDLPDGFHSKEESNAHDGSDALDEETVSELAQRLSGLTECRFIIVDGFMLYWDNRVLDALDCKISLTTSYKTLKSRREARQGYHTADGYWVDPPGYFDQIVWPEYVRLRERDHALKEVNTIDTDENSIQQMMYKVVDQLNKDLI